MKYGTRWRSGVDSNPRYREVFYGRSWARVWRTIRPDKKPPCWREFVRLGFGSETRVCPVAQRSAGAWLTQA